MNKNNIAIIGAAGFVGSRLTHRLAEKNISFIQYDSNIDNYENDITFLDIEKPNSLDKLKNTDTIINLAAIHRDDVSPISRYDDVNVQGSKNICDIARKFGIKQIVFTSSVAIYGFAPSDTDETGKPNYFNDYGRTKYLAEAVYKKWQAEDPKNRTLVIIRPTVIFGEGNRGNVYNLLKQIASGRFVMLGNGKNKKSMAYVENVVAFIIHCLSFKSGIHIYNYIDKPDYDMNSLVSLVRKLLFNKKNVGIRLPKFVGLSVGYLADFLAKITGKTFPISSIRVKKFMGTTKFKSSVSNTGFVPPISLEEGLKKTIHYEFLEDNSKKRTFDSE